MESHSLTQILLDRLMEQTGLGPGGDLIDRLRQTPPAVLRGIRSRDAESVGLAASLPLDMASAIVEVLGHAVTDDGRFSRDQANAYMAEQAQAEDDDDEDGPGATELMRLVHDALGIDAACEACSEWVERHQESGTEDADEHGHHDPERLLAAVYAAHPEQVDAWEPQIALRIAREAGNVFGRAAGFGALHEVVAHSGGAPGISREGLVQAHALQHLGMARCEDAAEAHALRVSLAALRGEGGVSERMLQAEQAAVEDALSMAGIPAAVAVGLVAQQVEQGLAAAPVPPAARRLPKAKRRR